MLKLTYVYFIFLNKPVYWSNA